MPVGSDNRNELARADFQRQAGEHVKSPCTPPTGSRSQAAAAPSRLRLRVELRLQARRCASAEKDVHDFGVAREPLRRPFVYLLAVVHDHDARRKPRQKSHHMLDEDNVTPRLRTFSTTSITRSISSASGRQPARPTNKSFGAAAMRAGDHQQFALRDRQAFQLKQSPNGVKPDERSMTRRPSFREIGVEAKAGPKTVGRAELRGGRARFPRRSCCRKPALSWKVRRYAFVTNAFGQQASRHLGLRTGSRRYLRD